MRVHLIKKQTLVEFSAHHARSRPSLEGWLEKLKHADWKEPGDMKRTYNSADVLGKGSNRVVFNLGGNDYRMICKYAFGEKQIHLFVCWIGTHADYTELSQKGEQYTRNSY